ncbi:uncharacterized protein [Pyrus communis]|uniref:uncharacterized protein n=1 Tax=Pyrus communis TaxID=23211 RepID=UPI0035C0FB2D
MIFYANNNDLICKIFTTTLQGEVKDWFHTLPPRFQNFSELSLVFTKEYSSYRWIKKKSDHLFNMKNNLKESLRTYIKRFKMEKENIVKCDDSIMCSAFLNGLSILRDLKDKSWFKPLPPPMRANNSKMDQTKFCAFHRSPGHITNECTTWMKYLEKLVKKGKCDHFTKQDAKGIDFPHDDTLVIFVLLAHAIVDRIMMDNNSLVNILQLSVIQKMSLESTIRHKAGVLTRFNGPTSTVIGTIMLDVTNHLIVSSQTFMIVGNPSPYNEILGRPWLVKIEAVTSIEY